MREDEASFHSGLAAWATVRIVAAIAGSLGPILAIAGDQYYVSPCDRLPALPRRAGVPTAFLHQDTILKYPDGQIFDVITDGTGVIGGYRWPIPAYVRELERQRLAKRHGRARRHRLREAP